MQGCDRGEPATGIASTATATAETTSATVLLDAGYAGNWPTGLDPATNLTARANLNLMNAIYGGLFQLAPGATGSTPEIVGVLAAGFEISDDGMTVSIRLRDGVTFSDGTPLDAEAVRFNIERNLSSSCTCAPHAWPWAEDDRVRALGTNLVQLHFSRPYGAVMHAFPVANINWIASPTALAAMGEDAFRLDPVGAGPFRVVSNQLSTRLVLEKNPLYFDRERPFLDELIFQSIGSEQAAVQALLAGDAHAYLGLTSIPLMRMAESHGRITVTRQPGTSPYVIQLNTLKPPFDDIRVREAIYFATDVDAILAGLFEGEYPISQSFTGQGGLFYQERVPGYRGYDPERARSIIEDAGGLTIELGTIRSFVAEQVITALQAQWEAVGIEVTIETFELPTVIDKFLTGNWQSMLMTAGSYDPEAANGVTFRFRSDQPYTGVHDLELDHLLVSAAATADFMQREKLYQAAGQHISDHAYAPFLFAFAPAQLTTSGLEAPGLTTSIPPIVVNTGVLWHDARFAPAD
jgi:peptide/nickel transport system substrate-binding protein